MLRLKANIALAAAALVAASAGASAQEYPEVTYRYATGFPKTLYMHRPAEYFAAELEKRTGGRMKVKMFYSGALGKSNEILDLVSKGAVDMGSLVQGYFASALPFAAMTNSLPMTFFDGPAVMRAAMQLDKTNPTIREEYARNNIVPLVYRYLPNYKLICTKPVTKVADLKGLKIRTFGTYMPRMFAALEVTPVNVLPTDMYEALKRGSMDCSYLTNANFVVYKLHEVAKYIIDVKFGGIHAYFLAMNKTRWDALPDHVKALMAQIGEEATEHGIAVTVQAEKDALEKMTAEGAVVVKFEEQQALQDAVPDMVEIWIEEMKKIGKEAEARQYAAELMALLAK